MFFFDAPEIVSIMSSNEAINVLLVSAKLSNAPAFIKLSIHFLFTASPSILSQKSVKLMYSPFFSLFATIVSTAASPTFLILPSPNLILPPSTVNFV